MSDFKVFRGTDRYLTSPALEAAVNVALVLEKPLLLRGEPGTGKTQLAEAISKAMGLRLIYWPVKSTTRAQDGLYHYDTVQRLYDSRFGDGNVKDISAYIRMGPLGQAFQSDERVVLLIDEVDKADIEFPNDLLNELDSMRFFISETQQEVAAKQRPIVLITSNNEKELPDPFLRRCVFHFIEFPDPELMRNILDVHHPGLEQALLQQALDAFFSLREAPLRKRPSTSELIDWITALKAAGVTSITLENLPFIGTLLKKEQDLVTLKERLTRQRRLAQLMFIPFLYVLREHGVPVGAQEALNLAQAMARGLHQNSLDEFYHLARCLMVHRESHLDAFDAAFYAHFHGVQWQSLQLQSDLLDWLQDPKQAQDFEGLLAGLDPEELRRQFEERLQEQTERHDGGSKWIGTGGRSPFGHSGAKQPGIRVGGKSRHRSAIHVAGERRFANYRNDRQLDVRQYGVALRKLRSFARDGNDLELDVEDTIEATAQNAGELELVLKAPRRPNTRVVLMMDVGGSMDSHIYEVERLFSAAAASTHFKEFRSYYFHNCIYDKLYLNADFTASVSLKDFLRGLNKSYRLVMIGDAAMAPYELFNPKGQYFFRENKGARPGWESLVELAAFFERAIWLNPEEPQYWQGIGSTREAIARIFPMYPLTVDGLDEAIKILNGKRPPRLMPLQDLF